MCKDGKKDTKEDIGMNAIADRIGYNKLDLKKLKFSDEIVSTKDAIQDIVPIQWSHDVLEGKKKAVIKRKG